MPAQTGDAMDTDSRSNNSLVELFAERISGGAFAYKADEGHELLFANRNTALMFECEDYEELFKLVGNSFDGMVDEVDLDSVNDEIETQIREHKKNSGYILFTIKTKNGGRRMVANNWTLAHDDIEATEHLRSRLIQHIALRDTYIRMVQ